MRKTAWILAVLLFSGNAFALDGMSLEYGHGYSTEMGRVAAFWDFDRKWFDNGDWMVTGYWEADLGSWRGHSAVGNNQTITEIGITPVFRFQQRQLSGIAPYLEGGIGLHLIKPTFIYTNRHFSTAFQFGEHIGFGARFGERHQFDLGIRYQHISNADIKKPNQGINFSQIRFAYNF